MKAGDFFTNAKIFIGKRNYSVPKLAAYAKGNLKIQELSIEWIIENLGEGCGWTSREVAYTIRGADLMHTVEHTRMTPPAIGSEHYIRSFNSDLSYPILIIKEPEGFWVGDGNHRLAKAIHIEKVKSVKAYIIKPEDLEVINENR